MPRDGAEKAAMPGRVSWPLTLRVVELSVWVGAVPGCHHFLQGNACPTNSASARAGNRVDYTTGSRPYLGLSGDGLSYIPS